MSDLGEAARVTVSLLATAVMLPTIALVTVALVPIRLVAAGLEHVRVGA